MYTLTATLNCESYVYTSSSLSMLLSIAKDFNIASIEFKA